jgi:LPXTG-site transpeptidase (sortase) family protein
VPLGSVDHRSAATAAVAVDDDVHRLGRRRFIAGLGAAAGAGAVGATFLADTAHALPPGASVFQPLARQTRFADTRNPGAYPFERLGPNRIRVQITGREGIPANATAAVLTLTAIDLDTYNFVTVYPADTGVPEASNLNMARFDEAAANLATVQIGAGGGVEVDSYRASHMIVDVAGYYVPVNGAVKGGRFVALNVARRAIDTRSTGMPRGGESVVVDVGAVGVPADATSVAVNLTTTGTLGWGFFTCYPLDTDVVPESSNLNVNGPGEERAAAAIVKVTTVNGVRGFKVWTYSGGHVIVDVAGYFTGNSSDSSTDGLFVPMAPLRILDTRKPGTIGKLWKDWMVESAVPGDASSQAQAIAANVTAVDTRAPGFFTVLAAGTPLQVVSNLNADTTNETIPNHVITRISTRGVAVYAQWGAHILIDMAGWYTGTPAIAGPVWINPPPPAIGPPWTLEIPRIGVYRGVYAGSSSLSIVNAGNVWHWTGTGYMGQDAHVAMFAHRTEHGGLFRYMNLLGNGDLMNVYTTDGRKYVYQVVRRDITSSRSVEILEATTRHPGPTLTIIACSRPDGTPTSLSYRLLVTGELLGWEEY